MKCCRTKPYGQNLTTITTTLPFREWHRGVWALAVAGTENCTHCWPDSCRGHLTGGLQESTDGQHKKKLVRALTQRSQTSQVHIQQMLSSLLAKSLSPPPSSVNYFCWLLGYFHQKPVFMSISMFWGERDGERETERERSQREHTYVSMGEFVCCWRRG